MSGAFAPLGEPPALVSDGHHPLRPGLPYLRGRVLVCEAEERLLRIRFEIELQWGSGKVDLGKLKDLATGLTSHDTVTLTNTGQVGC